MRKYFSLIGLVWLSCLANAQTVIPNQVPERSSIKFNGNLNYADAGTNNRNITNEITLEAWIKTRDVRGQWLVSKENGVAGYHLAIQNGRAVFGGAGGLVTSSGLSQTIVADNKWHHLAGTYKAGKWEIWVDGILESTSAAGGPNAILTSNAVLTIARNPLDPTQYFNGQISEIKIWNAAKNAGQIRNFMAKVVKYTSPDLVGYFRCDLALINPKSSTVLKDFSDLHIDGQINTGYFNYVAGPPIGDESFYYYGADLNSKLFRFYSDYTDTLSIRNFTGNAQGFHFYKRFTTPTISGYRPLNSNGIVHYYGMLSAGDTNATYQVKFTMDSAACNRILLLYTRTSNDKGFMKLRPGPYNPVLDTASHYTVKERGELTYLIVNENTAPLKVFANQTVAKCPENRPTTLTASKGYFYQWSTGDTTKSIQVSQTGKYWVRIYNYCNLMGSDTFRVEIAPPVKLPSLRTSDTTICDNDPLQLSMPQGYHYLWPDGSTAETFAITTAGTYSVTVTDPRCGNSQSSAIRVRTVPCGPEKVFIPNIITPNNDGFNDYFTTIGLPPGTWGLTIYNRWGKPVYQNFHYQNNWNAEGLNAGVYYYYFQSANSAKSFKGFVEVVR